MRKVRATGTGRCVAGVILAAVVLAGCQGNEKIEVSAGTQETAQAETAEIKELAQSETTERERTDGFAEMDKAEEEKRQTDKEVQADDAIVGGLEPDGQEAADEEAAAEEASEKEAASDVKTPPAGWELVLASEDWGLSFGEPGTPPRGNAQAEDLAWYDAYYVGEDKEKVIYLTFDCGYENGNTEPILDALRRHDAQASFFVVGHYLETASDLVKRMVEEGHAVGNHTYHHLDMATISDQGTFRKELDDVADLFRKITGTELSPYYRPPQGKCNVENLKMAQQFGYRTIFWSLAYVDWNPDDQPSHEEAFDKLTSRVHPGAVVLLHNTSQTNGEILDELLTKWEEMGYTFKPLAELTDSGR